MIQSMPLDKGWRIVIRFAFVGFALGIFAALAIVLQKTYIVMAFEAICPAMWFWPHVPWPDAPAWLAFAYIPIVNAAAYAVLGALIAGLTTKPSR